MVNSELGIRYFSQKGSTRKALHNNGNRYNKESLRDTSREYIAKREFAEKAFIDRFKKRG